MLEIPWWVTYVKVYISVKDNRKMTVNPRKEKAPNSNRKRVDAFLMISKEEDRFFRWMLTTKVLANQRDYLLFETSYFLWEKKKVFVMVRKKYEERKSRIDVHFLLKVS